MGKIFAALGRLFALPLSKLGASEPDYDGPPILYGFRAKRARRGARKESSRLRRASKATSTWAQEKAIGFGFLTTVFVFACGFAAGLFIAENAAPLVKLGIGLLGVCVGYGVGLLVLIAVFFVTIGPKPAAP